jgi:hypothetical protein
MRVPEPLEARIVEAIRRVARANPNLMDPWVADMMLTICHESYRAGVCAMQEPLQRKFPGPEPLDDEPGEEEAMT